MSRKTEYRSLAPTFVALITLAGCGGGGGGASTPPALPVIPTPTSQPSATPVPVVPGVPAAIGSATFTVYTAKVDGQTIASMGPVGGGPPDSSHTWLSAPGAYVIYPDKSIQVTDATGSFDASKASWTTTNAPTVAHNPNASPELRIVVPGSTAAVPLYTSVLPLNTFDSTLTAGSGIPSSFLDLVVVPSGAAMFDDEVRVYEAVGQDTGGGLINVAPAVKWSLKVPAGCNNPPAGSLTVNPANPSIVTYKPPAAGTFVNNCYDQVVASIANVNSNTPVSATANAIYFSPTQAISFPGKVVAGTGSPVANAVVDIYGGSGVLGFGDFLALTDSTGSFVRNVPPLRPLTPFVDNITSTPGAPSVAAYSVTPTNVAVGPSGGHPPAVTLVEGAPFVDPYAPLPPLAFNIINSFDIGNDALLDVPFGLPNTLGALPACSIGAYISGGQTTFTACGGVVGGGGVYGGWNASIAADPTTGGNDFTFLQPPGGSGQQVLSVRSNITSYIAPNGSGSDSNAPQCSTAVPCASYARYFAPGGIGPSFPAPFVPANLPAGTILQIDGVFAAVSQQSTSTYTVNLIRNVYSGSFQILGQPQHAHAEKFVYPFGAASVTFADNWYNPLNQLGGSFTFSRGQTGSGYTFSGSGAQSFFRAGYAPATVSYTIPTVPPGEGVVTLTPAPATETYSVTSVNNSSQVTLNVNWSWNGIAGIGSTGSGTVTNAAGSTLATFVIDVYGDVTLTGANGGSVQQFVL